MEGLGNPESTEPISPQARLPERETAPAVANSFEAAPQGKLTFLGSGTSMGVPTLGCDCSVCLSTDPRDRRLRASALVQWPRPEPRTHRRSEPLRDATRLETAGATPSIAARLNTVLIDTGPDFREQALRAQLGLLDAVFYTHSHADHILGLDDLRPLSFLAYREYGPIPLWVTPETRDTLETIYDYTFSPTTQYQNKAKVELRDLPEVPGESVFVRGLDFIPVPVQHGGLTITGYRFGRAAYLTDVSGIPEPSFALLEGLDVLVLSALRHQPHPNHATVEQAVGWAKRIGARQTYLTHISHDLGHAATDAALPEGMHVSYDGLSVEFSLA